MVNKYWITLIFTFLIPIVLAERFELNLYSGWNLISIPFSSYNIDSCSNKKIYYYDSSSQSFKNVDINELKYLKGYWIYVKNDCKIIFDGTPLSTLSTLELKKGWNLIGAPFNSIPVGVVKSVCYFEKIYEYDVQTKKYIIPQYLKIGKGYWIYTNKECKAKSLLGSVIDIGESGAGGGISGCNSIL